MATFLKDLTFATRRIAKSPGLTAAAIVSIGLGVAANSTIFSMVSRFVLRPLPVSDPAALLGLHTQAPGERCCNNFSWPLLADVREQARSFTGIAAYYDLMPASIGGNGEPERAWGQPVTANYFDVVQPGIQPGRGFGASDENASVVVLSDKLWKRRFAADRAIIGKSIPISGHPFTVVGVTPPAFHGTDLILDAEFWVPLGNIDQLLPKTSNYNSRDYHWLQAIGRLKPGITQTQAEAELNVIAERLAAAHPKTDKGNRFRLDVAGSLPPRDKAAILLFLAGLSAVVFLVLCIACANVANLLLAQAAGRKKEMSIRLALGASRGRLFGQMLTESIVLALGGGGFGILLSLWATRALSAFSFPAPVPVDLSVAVDWRVLLYTLLLSLGTALVFGIAPAWSASKPVYSDRTPLRNFIVVSQIAIALVLLCATGLFLRSLRSAASIDVGFRSRDILMLSVDPQVHGYSPQGTAQLLSRLHQRVAALPGVQSAALTDVAPLSGGFRSDEFENNGQRANVDLFRAGTGYFETLGIRRLAGRDFGAEDPAGPKVAIVNEAFAQSLFRNESPLSRQVSGGGVNYRIVGVVGNVKSRTIGEDLRPVLYRSLVQTIGTEPSFMGYSLMVHSTADPASLFQSMRGEVRTLDPSLALFNVQTMQEHVGNALFLPRLAGALFGIFGMVGLVLSAVGLYGVMAYSVSRRTREIGIRMALGARAGGVQSLVVRQGMRLTFIALIIGLAAAWGVAKFSAALLYGVRPHDPWTFTMVPLFLAAIALAACWIPARRAARVDPIVALRYE